MEALCLSRWLRPLCRPTAHADVVEFHYFNACVVALRCDATVRLMRNQAKFHRSWRFFRVSRRERQSLAWIENVFSCFSIFDNHLVRRYALSRFPTLVSPKSIAAGAISHHREHRAMTLAPPSPARPVIGRDGHIIAFISWAFLERASAVHRGRAAP